FGVGPFSGNTRETSMIGDLLKNCLTNVRDVQITPRQLADPGQPGRVRTLPQKDCTVLQQRPSLAPLRTPDNLGGTEKQIPRGEVLKTKEVPPALFALTG